MFLKLAALLLCITFVVCDEYVQVQPCNGTAFSEDMKFKVSGCSSTDERCPLLRGTNHTVIIEFVPKKDFVNKTDFRVYGVFETFSVPYGKKADACASSKTQDDGTSCSDLGGFLANRPYRHTSTFSVSNSYPKIALSVKFVMYDRRSKDNMMCSQVKVTIMDPEESENEA